MGIDLKSILICVIAIPIFYFLWQRKKQFIKPTLYFSKTEALIPHFEPTKSHLSQRLAFLSLLAFGLAFLDPHFFTDKTPNSPSEDKQPVEGIAIYLVLDQSGSMKEEVFTAQGTIKKFDLLKLVTKQFILGDPKLGLHGRPQDMIGLIAFARGAHVLSPLTLDHAAVLSQLANFAPIGQRDEDGTSIGYAIFKTTSMIAATKHYAQDLIKKGEPAYSIKSTVMILMTDGMQDPNPLDKGKRLRNMDIPEAATYAKQQGIRLYIVNVEPKMSLEEFSANRHIMQRAAELTGGHFFMVDQTTSLEKIYRDIDTLEKSVLPNTQIVDKSLRPDLYDRVSLSPYFIIFGLISLLASICLDTILLRRIP